MEAIVTACDIIKFSYEGLCSCLGRISARPTTEVLEVERIETALFCWSIIDQFYAFSKLMEPFEENLKIWDTYKSHRAIASDMRNYMDHFSSNIRNNARKKGPTHPLHGTILFSNGIDDGEYVEYTTFMLGTFHHAKQVSPVIDTHQKVTKNGISNISFAAFDKELSLSLLFDQICSFISSFDINFEKNITEYIRAKAIELGENAEKLLSDRVSGIVKATLRIKSPSKRLLQKEVGDFNRL